MKKKAFIIAIASLLIISATFAYYVIEKEGGKEKNASINAILIIDFGNGTAWHFNLSLENRNATVYKALNKAARQNGFEIKATYYEQYDSYFIESIAGKGGNGKYWVYYVNGKMGEVGADKKVVKEGDIIEWKLEG